MDTDEFSEESERQSFVAELVRRDMLDGAASGVAKQYAAQGWNSLSEKQKWLVNEHVLDRHKIKQCSRCKIEIPWSEQIEALDNGGLCSWCAHMSDKLHEDN